MRDKVYDWSMSLIPSHPDNVFVTKGLTGRSKQEAVTSTAKWDIEVEQGLLTTPFASDLGTASRPHRSYRQTRKKKQARVLAESRSSQRIQVCPEVPARSHDQPFSVNKEAMRDNMRT